MYLSRCQTCDHGNKHSSSMKGREFLHQVSDYYLPKKDSVHGIFIKKHTRVKRLVSKILFSWTNTR